MAASTLVSLSEYLRTRYRPDCDWVDGEVRERDRGEGPHSSVQKFFIRFFGNREEEFAVRVWPEQRVQVAATRYRIPDVCLSRWSAPFEEIIRVPPLLCIEILSRDDRMSEMQEKVDDYLQMGGGGGVGGRSAAAKGVSDERSRPAARGGVDGPENCDHGGCSRGVCGAGRA